MVRLPLGRAGAGPRAPLPGSSATTPTPASPTSSPSSTRRSTGSRTTPRATARRATWRPGSRRGTTPTRPGSRCSAAACARARVNAAAVGAPPEARGVVAGFDELLGRRVSMRALALLRVLAGPAVLLHLQPFLSDALDGRTYRDAFYEPYAAWYPELPDAVYVGLLCAGGGGRGGHVARLPHPRWPRPRRSRSSPTTSSSPRRTSTTTAPTWSSSWGCWRWRRAGASCRSTPGCAAAGGDRRSTPRRRPGRCGCCGSSARRSTARPG